MLAAAVDDEGDPVAAELKMDTEGTDAQQRPVQLLHGGSKPLSAMRAATRMSCTVTKIFADAMTHGGFARQVHARMAF